MWISALVWLKQFWRFWPLILGVVLGVVVSISIYRQGVDAGKSEQLIEQQSIVADYKDKVLKSEQAYSALLVQSQQEAKEREAFNQSQSIMLAKSNQARDAYAAQLRKDVGNAVKQDNQTGVADANCVGGLGLNSLRLYKNALGYNGD